MNEISRRKPMRFCTVTLGCKVNQFDTQSIEEVLISRGHTLVKPGEGCDICIINTCAVTAESSRKSRQAVRRIKKMEPGALIAVCGCYSQLEPSGIEQIGADLISGTGDRREFALELETKLKQGDGSSVYSSGILDNASPAALKINQARTRALLKIQDGCSNHCTYCIVPHVRGQSRSVPLQRISEQARQLEVQGFREIVITGIEISSFIPCLIDAVKAVSKAAPGVRIRLGSLDPGYVTEAFCHEMSEIPKLCDHFHLSVQSGCDETLQRMGRRYTADMVYAAINGIRRCFPDSGITADLITGFPGETEHEYVQTLEFIKTARFSGMHIFPYSLRPGTKAAEMPGQIMKGERRERARIATEIAEDMSKSFIESQLGKIVEVLLERKRDGHWIGHSGNYLEVAVKGNGRKNNIANVRLTDYKDGIVYGEIV